MNQHGRRRWKKTRNWKESSKTFKRFSKYASWFTVIIHNNAYYYILSKYEVLGGVFCLPHHKAMIFFPTKKMNHLHIQQKRSKLKWWKIYCIFSFYKFLCRHISESGISLLLPLLSESSWWLFSVLNGSFSMHQIKHFKGLWRLLRTAYCLHSLNNHLSKAVLIHAQSCSCPFHSQKLIKTLTLIHLFQQ